MSEKVYRSNVKTLIKWKLDINKKIQPKIAIRTSLSDFRQETWMTNVPLYLIGNYF